MLVANYSYTVYHTTYNPPSFKGERERGRGRMRGRETEREKEREGGKEKREGGGLIKVNGGVS